VPAQTLSELASDLEEYLPEVHNVQMLDEEAVEYDPATHFMQVEDVEAPVPAEYVPAAHPVHALDPDEGENLPAVQRVHSPSANVIAPLSYHHVSPFGASTL